MTKERGGGEIAREIINALSMLSFYVVYAMKSENSLVYKSIGHFGREYLIIRCRSRYEVLAELKSL